MKTIWVRGLVAVVQGRFVCWDSHKAKWFLGPRRLAEIFAWRPLEKNAARMAEVLRLYPSAEIRYERDKDA